MFEENRLNYYKNIKLVTFGPSSPSNKFDKFTPRPTSSSYQKDRERNDAMIVVY